MKQELIHIIKLSENSSQSNFVYKKPSLNKPLITKKTQPLQLPRFFSSDQKYNKNVLLIPRTETEIKEPINHKINTISKKEQSKYSKTQKKQTPPKIQSSMKQIKIVQQYKRNFMSTGPESKQESKKGTTLRKTEIIDQIISIQEMHQLKRKNNKKKQVQSTFSNPNRIKYKISLNKRDEKQKRNSQKIIQFETEGRQDRQLVPKTSRLGKIMTEQTPIKNSGQTINRVSIKNQDLFSQYLKETTSISTQMRINNKNKLTLKSFKLGKGEISYLQLVFTLLQNLNSQLGNQTSQPPTFRVILYSQLKIKVLNTHLCLPLAKVQVPFSKFNHILKDYLLFIGQFHPFFYHCQKYLSDFIKTSLKSSHLHECKLRLNELLSVNPDISKRQKYFSQQKASSQKIKPKFQGEQSLSVQNRGNNLTRNNQMIRFMLESIINKKNFPHHQLFQSIMSKSNTFSSFEQIALLDKTLKWQVLKMPTFPFLPECQTSHQHYLILDLDETLIHFEPQKNLFHVRPYTEQFLINLSKSFQITIFTAATKEYADEIINQIDKSAVVKHRLYRNHLTFLEGESIKDISMLGRNLKTTLIIDNLESNFRLHINHGIAIKSWYGSSGDNILQKLQSLLLKIVKEFPQDLREGIKKYQNFIDRQISEKTMVKVKYKI